MAQPVWQTQTNLGSFTSGSPLSILLIARPVSPATSVTYTISAGSLPTGLTLDTVTGFITGSPIVFPTADITFSVLATDNLGNTSIKTFSMQVIYFPAQPIWNTPAGVIGSYPSLLIMAFELSADPVSPSTSVTYQIISGSLPSGLSLSTIGLISGTPTLVTQNTRSTFTIRVTDNLGNLRDRTFSMNISGSAIPFFTTPNGSILDTIDSLWTNLLVNYSNPSTSNPVIVQVKEGELPPGLEIDLLGNIRGYPRPPIVNVTTPSVVTFATQTSSLTNLITVTSTIDFFVGRPVTFSGTLFGDLSSTQQYYVKSIPSSTTFSVSTTVNGSQILLTDGSGIMTATLPAVSTGQPTIRTYSFTLELTSPLGGDTGNYTITVRNQNNPTSQGGPGFLPNTRKPTILNTRPLTFNLTNNDPYYGYYILPPVDPSQSAFMGNFQSGEYFAFKFIGYDFDGNSLTYAYSGLPSELTGDTQTGWITGTPALSSNGISSYSFSVGVYKSSNPGITSPFFNFTYNLRKGVTGNVVWSSDSDLGQIFNGSISTLFVRAISDIMLSYRITSGELPPNLSLASNGQITGRVADQPTNSLLTVGDTTAYSFTVQAYSTEFPAITSSKSFTLNVLQEFDQPTDTLYIQATPSLNDRQILSSLLNNDSLIPPASLYRQDDQYFGKASSVIYEHAYGIFASDIQEYLQAVTQNHYWRNITLGELKTAVAKNSSGEIIYEVVYSEVIDNLVNPQGVSIQQQIYWPRPIDLGLGPWYTSSTDIFTSYVNVLGQDYYTSLTPGFARRLYPNSLYNMRNRVSQVLGQVYNSTLLPLWMTSQQSNGSTLGYTQSWVICYTKPGFSDGIKANIENNWDYTLNQINFEIDRFSVDKSATYNYDSITSTWDTLPAAVPTPDPLNSKDFYVLFPQRTILPNESQ